MFKSLRWRLTIWFVVLTSIVFTSSALVGLWLFRIELTRVIDDELHALADELRPAIFVNNGLPSLREWSYTSHKIPFKFSQSIQLYNPKGGLIESYGPPGIPQLSPQRREFKTDLYRIRNFATPIVDNNRCIGYLQIQLSLKNIEHAVNQFGYTMTTLAPFLLIGLGMAGYVFSIKAAAPVEESFMVLRRFMSDAGHELSTPISIIQANAEAMEVEVPASESSENRLSVIFRSTERMSNLVTDLMLLSKMESPQLFASRTSIDSEKLTRTVVEEFEELFKGKSITLKVKYGNPAPVMGNLDSLKRMLTNLLQNALRYTDASGTVEVGVENAGRNVKFTVADTGIGIPPESLPLIFDRFYRVDTSRSRAQGGAGLGLSIVKAIVDAHRGKVEVHSQVGKGTTFVVTLPSVKEKDFFGV
jgi:two-component system, OmpR family, manganese sensing sensor histidine kinase